MSSAESPAGGNDETGPTGGAGLDSASAKEREETIRGLRAPLTSETITALAAKVRADPNANVRRTAAEALGRASGSAAVEALSATLRDSAEEGFVRAAAARALGTLREDSGVAALAEVVSAPADPAIKLACVESLGAIASPDAIATLTTRLPGFTPWAVRARAVVMLGEAKADGEPQFAAISDRLEQDQEPKVVKAAMKVIVDVWPDRAGPLLVPFLGNEDAALARRAAEVLGGASSSDAGTRALVAAALLGTDAGVREAAATTTTRVGQPQWIVASLVDLCRTHRLDRTSLDENALALVTQSIAGSDDRVRSEAADVVLTASVDADEAATGMLALVLVHCCGRDVAAAGAELNRFASARADLADKLTAIRVALGGRKALDPILRQLQEDLETYFQVPVHHLNERTIAGWQTAAGRARFAFGVRVIMSLMVFVVGIALIVVSVVLWVTGREDPAAIWGAGASLVSGLAAMLAVTYRGPLRDVGQSMRDLGASTAAFIGFVHRISQVSHTFTGLYLRQQLTLEDAARLSRLIRDATRETVELLGEGRSTAPVHSSGDDAAAAEERAAEERAAEGRADEEGSPRPT